MRTLTRAAYAEPGTSLNFKTGTWRVQKPQHVHGAAPCHLACPSGEDAQAWLALFEQGQTRAAWETLVQANPLPAITGRVCHHPCESHCNRGRYDEPVAIHLVERHLGDEAIRHQWAYPLAHPVARPGAPALAVVGAGPAGLACAYHLKRLGYRVVLLEELPVAGGTMRTALPNYRLPRDVLDAEVGRLLQTGIEFRPHQKLGRDYSLHELQQQYGAVFLAPGTQRGREWSVDGVTPRGLTSGLALLREWVALGNIPMSKSAAIVGGGNTAVDLARILKRAGVADVHVITHQSLPRPGAADVMRALPREIAQAREEGIVFHEHRGIRRLILRGERVVGIELVHMKNLDQGQGKHGRVAFEGTETVLHVDQVIPAIGQDVEGEGLAGLLGVQQRFDVDLWGQTARAGLFAGGDARTRSSGTVSGAIGDGRRAAQAMHRQVIGQAQPQEEARRPAVPYERLNLHYYEPGRRPDDPVVPAAERQADTEVDGGYTAGDALQEARRCLSCGNCLACDNCWTLCPDAAVLKTRDLASDGSHYVFDYDYCKGCGLCARECPCGYIAMAEDL